MAEKEYIEREAAIETVKKERDYTGKFTFEEEHAWAVGFQLRSVLEAGRAASNGNNDH